MTGFQKAIKIIAIVFAISLTVSIIGAIVNVAGFLISTFSEGDETFDGFSEGYDREEINNIRIENSYGKLIIKSGNEFLVEADGVSSGFETSITDSGTLVIDNTGGNYNWARRFFGDDSRLKNAVITMTLPEGFKAEGIEIENGFGSLDIEAVTADYLRLKLGAGDCEIKEVTTKTTRIDAGVGELDFADSELGNMDLKCGVGEISIEGKLIGNNDIDCGVGEVSLKIFGSREDYDISITKGIGSIYIDGKKQSADVDDNEGAENVLNIKGGVGEVSVDFTETE